MTLTANEICDPPQPTLLNEQAVAIAEKNVHDILSIVFEHTSEQAALVVFDTRCDLSIALTEAYRRCLVGATFIDFDATAPAAILAMFERLAPADLVALIQSSSFRLDAYRMRVELFKRSLKVIEHPHLARMPGVEALYYIESLAYDPEYYRVVGRALKQRIDNARSAVIDTADRQCTFSGYRQWRRTAGICVVI